MTSGDGADGLGPAAGEAATTDRSLTGAEPTHEVGSGGNLIAEQETGGRSSVSDTTPPAPARMTAPKTTQELFRVA
ncbi:MAG TPA: hypothetical protein VEJ84_07785, partial [Acidimicrobiales bacterium]|nr:hypothetical protein [Acidimicrobiales bacterium]